MLEDTKVYAFVGPSGTGKSFRAQKVASDYKIKKHQQKLKQSEKHYLLKNHKEQI